MEVGGISVIYKTAPIAFIYLGKLNKEQNKTKTKNLKLSL